MKDIEKNRLEPSTLYLVATPIGNLADISERAIKVLREADFIAAEDTRNTLKLLMSLGIKNELVSYFEHNKRASGEKIVARLLSGECCALVTDAGTPAIADPGFFIVREAVNQGVKVEVIPGVSALTFAAAATGLPVDKFAFYAFPPVKSGRRGKFFEQLAAEDKTVFFYESPYRVTGALEYLEKSCGPDRKIAIVREATKLHEEVVRTTLGEAVEKYTQSPPKGEFVLVVAGAPVQEKVLPTESDAAARVAELMASGISRKDAIKQTAKELDLPKNVVYDAALQ